MHIEKYDVMVIGAGHAGCEAALASARMGQKTAILTITLDNIGVMSCNPSIGGPAKSHLVKELDALGGEMGRNIDKTFIQIRVLNTKKGPAVRSLRAQADKKLYHKEMKKTLENTENLDVIQGMVTDILVEDNKIVGLKTKEGVEFRTKSVVVATGTFMNGLMHIGDKQIKGGRMGELSSEELPLSLEKIGLKLGRFKTGTPPRVDFKSIDLTKVEPQPGDTIPLKFSRKTTYEEAGAREQIPCYITFTNQGTTPTVDVSRVSTFFHGRTGSSAANAGLKKGDVITAINDTKVSTVADLKYQLYKYNVGDKVTVTFNRNGTEKTATATLTKNE